MEETGERRRGKQEQEERRVGGRGEDERAGRGGGAGGGRERCRGTTKTKKQGTRGVLCDRRALSCLEELSAQCRDEWLVRRMHPCDRCRDHNHRSCDGWMAPVTSESHATLLAEPRDRRVRLAHSKSWANVKQEGPGPGSEHLQELVVGACVHLHWFLVTLL